MIQKINALLFFLIKITTKLLSLSCIIIFFLLCHTTTNAVNTGAAVNLIRLINGKPKSTAIQSLQESIFVKEGSTCYTSTSTGLKKVKAVYTIEKELGIYGIRAISINGTLDGGHTDATTLATTATPALLICTTGNNTDFLTISDSFTIGKTGMLTTSNASALKISVPLKANIVNNGTITANTCIEITTIIDGNLTNNGTIKASNNGTALKINITNQNTTKKSFAIINNNTIIGNLIFKASNNDFTYNLKNLSTQNTTGYITTNQITIDTAKLNIINDNATFNISKLTLDNKASLEITNANNGIFKVTDKIENLGIVKINDVFKQKSLEVKNNGYLHLETGSSIKSYTGAGELVIHSQDKLSNQKILLNVIENATFTKKSKIIINTSSLKQQEVEITVIKACKIKLEDDIDKILYSILSTRSLLLHISAATIENTAIKAKVKHRDLSSFEMNAANRLLAQSLAKDDIIATKDQHFKTTEEYKTDLKKNKEYQNQQNIECITLITKTIDSILNNRTISSSLATIDIPRVEDHQSVSDHNKIVSSVIDKQKEKRKKWFKKSRNISGNKESSIDFWILGSYHISKPQEKDDKPHKEWQDQSICIAVESNNTTINAGLCYINTKSLINIKTTSIKTKKIKYEKTYSLNMKSISGLSYIVHEIGNLTNSYVAMYGRTEHRSVDRDDFNSKEYSAIISTSYSMQGDVFELDLGITSRLINIYTPMHHYKLSDVSIGYDSKYYFSIGSIISFAINGKLFESVYASLELNTGYLRTAGINDKHEINVMLKSIPFMKIKQEYYVKDSVYAEAKIHFVLNKFSFGVIANCNYDNNRLLYGGSGFINISF